MKNYKTVKIGTDHKKNLNNPMFIKVIELISKRLLIFGSDNFRVEFKNCIKKSSINVT